MFKALLKMVASWAPLPVSVGETVRAYFMCEMTSQISVLRLTVS